MGDAIFSISDMLKKELKRPLGTLIADSTVNRATLTTYLPKTGKLVSVGDKTTERLLENGFTPSVQIIDGIERRKPRERKLDYSGDLKRFLRVRSPAGAISKEALEALSAALKLLDEDPASHVRIEVEGEEDLLVLPVLAFFPNGTIVAYGQPGEGMVLVEAKGASRKAALRILSDSGVNALP